MSGSNHRRMRGVLIACLGLAMFALPAAANATSLSDVSGAGSGSTVIITGDDGAQKFLVSNEVVADKRYVKVKDQNGGAISTSTYCSRVYYLGVAVQSAVRCLPVRKSEGIFKVRLLYKGGNDVSPVQPAGGPRDGLEIDGGPGTDTLNGAPDRRNSINGGGDNDWLLGSPGPDTLIDTSGNDALLGGGGLDVLYTADGVPGDYALCTGTFSSGSWAFGDAGDKTSGCGNKSGF